MSVELGKLEQVDPRSVWTHEAHDFTPWLLANADRLSEALGIDLNSSRPSMRSAAIPSIWSVAT